ncbi:MAG: serine/threonine-protein kinase [Pseudomonadota bacterium]
MTEPPEKKAPASRSQNKKDGAHSSAPGDAVVKGVEGLKTVGRYEIIKKIGQGAAGVVYLGRDPYIKRNVAVKMSLPSSEMSRESFFVEAQTAGRLSHPNIVSIYDFGLHGEFCYITMEYVEGTTLEQHCSTGSLLPLNKVMEVIFASCQALDYAHKQGVIHLDVKPSNILLDKSGVIKLTDFGIAQVGRRLEKEIIIGTPFYIAPERLRGLSPVRQSDIFSLGCVLYELLTGEKAFGSDNLAAVTKMIKTKDPVPVTTLRPELPQSLDDIVSKTLAKDIKDRFQTCTDLAYYLRLALRDLTQTPKESKDFFDFVHGVPFFHSFSREQVRELVSASNIVRVRRGRIIVSEGEIDETFFIILSGQVKVSRGGREIAMIGAGECFGEMALIGQQARVATVEADTDCTLMKISATLLNRSPESVRLLFYQNFATTLVRRLSTTSTGTS